MANSYFRFKQFTIQQGLCAMKVTTDACLFGSILPVLPESGPGNRVLDIGTGTGLLSLMFAQRNPHAVIDAIELDDDACKQAAENCRASPWKENISVIHADINTTGLEPVYNLVICNPPFYENELKGNNQQKNIAHHSKHLTLQQLVPLIQQALLSTGIFYLLLPCKRKDEILKLIAENGMKVTRIIFVQQTPKHSFFRMIIEGSNCPADGTGIAEETICICDEEQQYTDLFKKLLSPYYLKC